MHRKYGFWVLVAVVAVLCLPLLFDILGCAPAGSTTSTTNAIRKGI
ncbi:MAG: hypothetical protein MUC35_00810 [Candidatus Margulisbacteria bacterium]|nr:hypothetical protein [Candidatus Margulisiibacteriota bacterium]